MARTGAQLGKWSGLGAKSDKVDLLHHFELLQVLPAQEFTCLRGGGSRDEGPCSSFSCRRAILWALVSRARLRFKDPSERYHAWLISFFV